MYIYIYPPVNSHRPCQIGVGRLVSTVNCSFSGYVYLSEGTTYGDLGDLYIPPMIIYYIPPMVYILPMGMV